MIRAALLARLVDGGHVPACAVDPQLCRLARLAELLRATAATGPSGPAMPIAARATLRGRLHELSPR